MSKSRDAQAIRLVLSHYWQQLKLDKRYALPGLLLPGIGSILIFYVPPIIIAKILNFLEANPNFSVFQLIPYIAIFTGSWLLGEICWRIGEHYVIRAETQGNQRLSVGAMNYLFEKDLGFYSDNFAGSLTKKVVGYTGSYIRLFDTLLFNISPRLIPLIFVIFILARFSPWLVVALLGMITVTLLAVLPRIRHRQKLVIAREQAGNILSGNVSDIVANMAAVKGFAKELYEKARHTAYSQNHTDKIKQSWDYQNLHINTIISPLYVLTNALGLVLALVLSRGNASSLEVVVITFSYFTLVTRFMWEFNMIYRTIETNLAEAAQFTELLLNKPMISDIKNPEPLSIKRGLIKFNDVVFRYQDNRGDHLFKDFNLYIKDGEKVGLVGRSGGGKTTLTKLILRFMDIDSGSISIDGQDITKLRQYDLRSVITYVPQEPLLFHRSLRENIRYGNTDATDAEIEKAAMLAHAHEFTEKLPGGYETLVGERGVKLSGGQRQRIAIARAMLKDAPILLLDEATSALDSESEVLIQDALWKLMKNKTAIVIAHRLSTIQRMDRIIVLDDGKIIEEGSHQELLARNGAYARLWAHQSGGFLEE